MEQQRSSEDMRPTTSHFWKTWGVVLGTLIAAGSVAGVIADAFYVRRNEYTTRVNQDSVIQAEVQQTLDRLNTTIRFQSETFDRMNQTLQDIKTDVAVLKSKRKWRGDSQ